jgi:hypothetical protein
MREPGDVVRDASQFTIADGSGDRFSGYAVIGLPFSSGHVLALRCFAASSLGAAYTSVWHRDPKGRWTFHQNVAAEQSCPRYFGAAITRNTMEPIRIDWTDPRRFCVTVDPPGEIVWDIRLATTAATWTMNSAVSAIPGSWWKKRYVLRIMETAARWMLGAGEMKLAGHTPNGHAFTAMPRQIWSIAESRATIRGVDAGKPAPLPQQAMLADLCIPQRGIFAIVTAVLETSAGPS